jgi:vancomycin resistance protein VanJ
VRVGQMERVLAYAAEAGGQPMIFGGDFNAPGGDGLFRPMRAYLRDAFYEAGVGWPDTIVNDSPVSRIDQVWISSELEATTLRAVETRNSDHRMVVCDVVVRR